MTCKICGAENVENATMCSNCGAPLSVEQPAFIPVPPQAQPYIPTPQNPVPEALVRKEIPEENKPLSPWAYFGLQLLFSIPVVGFIFLIVFSCSGANINRRNFARSYWCALLVAAILVVIYLLIMLIFVVLAGGSMESFGRAMY